MGLSRCPSILIFESHRGGAVSPRGTSIKAPQGGKGEKLRWSGDLPVSLVPKKEGWGCKMALGTNMSNLFVVGVTPNPHRHNAFYTVFQRTLADGRRGESRMRRHVRYIPYTYTTHTIQATAVGGRRNQPDSPGNG